MMVLWKVKTQFWCYWKHKISFQQLQEKSFRKERSLKMPKTKVFRHPLSKWQRVHHSHWTRVSSRFILSTKLEMVQSAKKIFLFFDDLLVLSSSSCFNLAFNMFLNFAGVGAWRSMRRKSYLKSESDFPTATELKEIPATHHRRTRSYTKRLLLRVEITQWFCQLGQNERSKENFVRLVQW